MIIKSLKAGINKALNWRLILIIWGIHLLFSLTFFLPAYFLYSKAFSRSLVYEGMLKGNISLFLEFLIHHKEEIGVLYGLFISLSFLCWLANLFLSGGILSIFKNGTKNLSDLFSKSYEYTWRFLKLSLLFLPLIILFFIVTGILRKTGYFLSRMVDSEIFSFYISILVFIISIAIFFILRMLFDYGRIRIVLEERTKIFFALIKTIQWTFKNFWKSFSLYILLTLFLFIFWVIFLTILNIQTNSGTFTLLIFLLLQLMLIFRSFLSLLFYSSQMELYRKSELK